MCFRIMQDDFFFVLDDLFPKSQKLHQEKFQRNDWQLAGRLENMSPQFPITESEHPFKPEISTFRATGHTSVLLDYPDFQMKSSLT